MRELQTEAVFVNKSHISTVLTFLAARRFSRVTSGALGLYSASFCNNKDRLRYISASKLRPWAKWSCWFAHSVCRPIHRTRVRAGLLSFYVPPKMQLLAFFFFWGGVPKLNSSECPETSRNAKRLEFQAFFVDHLAPKLSWGTWDLQKCNILPPLRGRLQFFMFLQGVTWQHDTAHKNCRHQEEGTDSACAGKKGPQCRTDWPEELWKKLQELKAQTESANAEQGQEGQVVREIPCQRNSRAAWSSWWDNQKRHQYKLICTEAGYL